MQPTQAARHAEGECKAVGRYVQHYNAAVNHCYMKELKNNWQTIIGSKQANAFRGHIDGISPCITEAMGMGGGGKFRY